MRRHVGNQIAGQLVQAGIRRFYNIAGAVSSPIAAALEKHPQLHRIPMINEESAALAATAEAQLTGRPAVVLSSGRSGSMRLINGILEAEASQAPLLGIISRHSRSALSGKSTPTGQSLNSACLHNTIVTDARLACTQLREALTFAHAKKCAALLQLPEDITLQSPQTPPHEAPYMQHEMATAEPSHQGVERMADMLNHSQRTAFLCGGGCAGAREQIIALARVLHAPIAYTLRGKEWMEKENPFAVGMSGLLGWGAAPRAILSCDLLVLWGTQFPYRDFLPTHGNIIQVNTDAAAMGNHLTPALCVSGDCKRVAEKVLPLLKRDRDDTFLTSMQVAHARAQNSIMKCIRCVDEDAALRPELVTRLISDQAEPDAILVADTGAPLLWGARYLHLRSKQRFIGSFTLGVQGNALPMAIGAKATYPTRQVIALCTPRGLLMRLGELAAAVQHGLPIKIMVYHRALPFNEVLDTTAKAHDHPGHQHTDFCALAQSMGLPAIRIQHAAEAQSRIRDWLNEQQPILLETVVDRHALPLPPDMDLLKAQGYCAKLRQHSIQGEFDHIKQLLFGNRRFFR